MGAYYLIKGDINGIQNFIYNVYEGEGGVARILRAKSFFVSAIPSVVKKHMEEVLNTKIEEILDGGGSFIFGCEYEDEEEFERKITEIRLQLEKFFLEEFKGELGVTIDFVKAEKEESENFAKLTEKVDNRKKRKFSSALANVQDKVISIDDIGNERCPVCRTFFFKNGEKCKFCEKFTKIGQLLPKKKYFRIEERNCDFDDKTCFEFCFGKKVYKLVLTDEAQDAKFINLVVPFLNERTVDKLRKCLKSLGLEKEFEEEVLDRFEKIEKTIAPFVLIAQESKGDKKLGYLKMDVDNLGLLFNVVKGEKARVLSSSLNEFFSKVIPEIALQFKPSEDSFISGTQIYLLYAGGDDLFAVGPWDILIDFAIKVNEEFTKNYREEIINKIKDTLIEAWGEEDFERKKSEILTLSAGFVAVRPKFTVRVSAEWVDDMESLAKSFGKNRFGIFGEALTWENVKVLLNKAKKFVNLIEENKVSKRFFYRLYQLYTKMLEGEHKDFMFYPLLHYTIGRTISDETVKRELVEFINSIEGKENEGIKFVCNYVLKATRGERDEG